MTYQVDTDLFHEAILAVVAKWRAENPGLRSTELLLGDGTKITIRAGKPKKAPKPAKSRAFP